MPISSSSPKAVRRAMQVLAAAAVVAGGTAVPATAGTPYDLTSRSDAAQRTSDVVAFAPGVSDAAQRTADVVAFAPGVSDAAQRTADVVAFAPGVSDAAQRTADVVAFGPGVSDAAQASADEPFRTSYQPAPAPKAAPEPVASADDGFDWTSALQGAAAGALFLLIGAAAVLSTRRLISHA